MPHEFAYQCPHCHNTVRITDDVMGQVVDCPVCDNPFQVDIPSATPVDASTVNEQTPGLDHPDRTEGELRVVHPTMLRSHPMYFLGYWAMLLLGVFAILTSLSGYEYINRTIQWIIGLALVVVFGFLLLKWWIETRWTTLIVTTKRTILRKGIIARNTTEVQHDDVRNIQVDQNIYERLVHVGDLAVSSSGQAELEIQVHGIPEPDVIAETIHGLQ